MIAPFKLSTLLVLVNLLVPVSSQADVFSTALPIWPEAMERQLNIFTGFRAEFKVADDPMQMPESKVVLRIAASSFYRVYLNGHFVARGPARGPHGFYRVDEWELEKNLIPGNNLLAVEVAGFNANGYGVLAQPSFLQAEISMGNKILAATGEKNGAGFSANILTEHVQKVQRYSFQRAFTEVYRMQPDYDAWRKPGFQGNSTEIKCSVQEGKKFIARRVPYPEFRLCRPVWDVCRGTVKTGIKPDSLWKDRALVNVGPAFLGFKEQDLETIPSLELQTIANDRVIPADKPFDNSQPLKFHAKTFQILDLGTNFTGFAGARITATKNTRLFVTFDEELTRGDVNFRRLRTVNAISYELQPGRYELESFEPYTMRFLKFTVLEGECEIDNVYLREYVNPEADKAFFMCSDQQLNKVFEAGRETFRQNATDLFMDCPSRERAGWLCDSYFTARAALDLCGNTSVEYNFFENFQLPESFDHIPDGMLPMCYPSDHYRGTFLPTWAIWFVIQLEEYLARSDDRVTVEALRERVIKLFDFFAPYRNSDGLLEKLDGWVILEWSAMNDFVNDVNYPINMLYAMALDAAAKMYDLPSLSDDAEKIRQVIRDQSFDGEFFVDNAVRKDGKLTPARNRTETCQYYAFLSGTATATSHPQLREKLINEFGPGRAEAERYPGIHPITPFIGYLLRLEVLGHWNLGPQAAKEIRAYYLPMAERNGTLWEMDYPTSSRNHGFQSHICHNLFRDILGLELANPMGREVVLRFGDHELDWCEGRIPVPEGIISLKWWRDSGKIKYRLNMPPGYTARIENAGIGELVREP
jgi:alpha-L-rhamnosidase